MKYIHKLLKEIYPGVTDFGNHLATLENSLRFSEKEILRYIQGDTALIIVYVAPEKDFSYLKELNDDHVARLVLKHIIENKLKFVKYLREVYTLTGDFVGSTEIRGHFVDGDNEISILDPLDHDGRICWKVVFYEKERLRGRKIRRRSEEALCNIK